MNKANSKKNVNKVSRIAFLLVIIGAIVIIALLIFLYISSQYITKKIQNSFNDNADILQSRFSEEGINYQFEKFHCHGIVNYHCDSSHMSFGIQDQNIISLSDIFIHAKNINDKDHIEMGFKTDILFDSLINENNKLLTYYKNDNSESTKYKLLRSHFLAYFLPTNLSCNINFEYDEQSKNKELISPINIYLECKLNSKYLNTDIKINGVIFSKQQKSSILVNLFNIFNLNLNPLDDGGDRKVIHPSYLINDVSIDLKLSDDLNTLIENTKISDVNFESSFREELLNELKYHTNTTMFLASLLFNNTKMIDMKELENTLLNIYVKKAKNITIKLKSTSSNKKPIINDLYILENPFKLKDFIMENYKLEFISS